MESYVRFALYFLVGGFTTLGASYLNESGKGGLAAIVASFPLFFLLTAMIAYYAGGPATAIQYSKGMIITNIPWLVAVLLFAYSMIREWHPAVAVVLSVTAYTIITAITSMVV
jgi:hypothetical protein